MVDNIQPAPFAADPACRGLPPEGWTANVPGGRSL